MKATYRFGPRPSYAVGASFLVVATFVATFLGGCSEERPARPNSVVVADRVPPGWPPPHATRSHDAPQIEAMRFSTLDIALGSEWNGDAVTTLDTTQIDVRTNLFEFTMPRTAPGRFHFSMLMLDLPAFLVRPYALHVVARSRDGRTTTMLVPFRIHGRV